MPVQAEQLHRVQQQYNETLYSPQNQKYIFLFILKNTDLVYQSR